MNSIKKIKLTKSSLVILTITTLLNITGCKSNPYLFHRNMPKNETSIVKLNEVIASKTEMSNTANGIQTIYTYWKYAGATNSKIFILFEQHIGAPKTNADISEKRTFKLNNGNINMDYYKLTVYQLSNEQMAYKLADKLR